MTTTVEPGVAEVEAAVRGTLAAHKSMFLATAGERGPWVGGVYFAEVGPSTLVLVLEVRGRTLAAVRDNPEVAVVVSTGSPMEPFLQANAVAEVVEGADDAWVRDVLVAKVPEAAPFLLAPVRAVRLTVESWRVTDLVKGWLPGKDVAV